MKLQIKNIAGTMLYEAEATTVSELLCLAVKDGANLRGAYLDGAYLDGAYLRGAYLDGANLRGANLDGAYLRGATTIETGETWAVYLSEVLPALLIAGGRALTDILTPKIWSCNSWDNCPMAEAFSTHSIEGVPALFRPRAEQFIRYFDSGLIPMESVGKIPEVKA